MSTYAEALRALESDGPAKLDDVRRWMRAPDLLTWSAVFTLVDSAPSRIQPELPADEAAEFMRAYLVRCIAENPLGGEHLHAGWEAAWLLAVMMKSWRRRGGAMAALIPRLSSDLEQIYRRGDTSARNRVLCGVLEHAFEDPGLRPFFERWNADPHLRDAYRLAMEWGRARGIEN